jgi:hypothetical protein
MWCFLPNHPDKEQVLNRAGIPCHRYAITKPQELEGIVFPEEYLPQVLELLKLSHIKFSKKKTNDGGIILLEMVVSGVTSEGGTPRNWQHIQRIIQEIDLPWKKIVVTNPKGTRAPINKKDTLYIHLYSTPGGVSYKLEKAFSTVLSPEQRYAFTNSENGTPIIDEDGMIVGETIGSNLYILFQLHHTDDIEMVAVLLRNIIRAFIKINEDPDFAKEQRIKVNTINLEITKLSYIKECSKRIAKMKTVIETNIRETQQRVKEVSRDLTHLLRSLENLTLQQIHPRGIEEIEQKFALEFEELLRTEHVKGVKIIDNLIQIFTDTIFVNYRGQDYELGDFRISIPTTGGRIAIHNLRNKELIGTGDLHHPHVTGSDGKPCFGNIAHHIDRLLGNYEYAVLVGIIIEYLKVFDYTETFTKYWKPMAEKPTIAI